MPVLKIMETAVNAVLPIVLVICVGFFLKTKKMLPESFFDHGSVLGFRILLPCMLFINVYNIEGFQVIPWDFVVFCVVAVIAVFLLGLVFVGRITTVPKRKGVVLQCIYRSNTAIIGIPLATLLGGESAAAVTSVVSAFTLPIFNVLAVIALTMFLEDGKANRNLKAVFGKIVRNPHIISIGLGMLCLLIRELQQNCFGTVYFSLKRDIPFLYSALNSIKAMASPFALLVLGGQFTFATSKSMFREIVGGTLWRIILVPALVISSAYLLSSYTPFLSCGPMEYPALVALFGAPVAVSSAIMAGQMGNDEQLASQLVVWSSLGSIISMFVLICVMISLGMLAI